MTPKRMGPLARALRRGPRIPDRKPGFWLCDESGQALVEQSILLATLLGVLAVGSLWLLRTQPEMIHALDVQIRGFYFVLSLPFP
jgi:hypothetical protein